MISYRINVVSMSKNNRNELVIHFIIDNNQVISENIIPTILIECLIHIYLRAPYRNNVMN